MMKTTTFRQELINQLAFNRARFLRSLLGLPAEALEQPIWEDYSARRILPHIARWDGFEAHRLSVINQGRLDELTWIAVDERNQAWHDEHAEVSAENGIAMLLKERNALLNVLAGMPDDILQATLTLADGFELPVLSCVTNSIEHDAHHCDDISAWRTESQLEQIQGGPPAILLANLKATRHAWQALFDLVGDRPIRVDGWQKKQILAHLSGWEQGGWASVDAGVEVVAYGSPEEANAAFVADSAEKSFPQLWQTFTTTRKKLETYVGNRSAEAINSDSIKTGSGKQISPYRYISSYIEHDLAHLDELYNAYKLFIRTK